MKYTTLKINYIFLLISALEKNICAVQDYSEIQSYANIASLLQFKYKKNKRKCWPSLKL